MGPKLLYSKKYRIHNIIQSGIWDINDYTARNIGYKILYSQEYGTQIIIQQR